MIHDAFASPRTKDFLPRRTCCLLLRPVGLPAIRRHTPGESPAELKPVTDTFDYSRREVMIPMRDGVKLHTVILVPKGAKRAHPPHPHALRRQA